MRRRGEVELPLAFADSNHDEPFALLGHTVLRSIDQLGRNAVSERSQLAQDVDEVVPVSWASEARHVLHEEGRRLGLADGPHELRQHVASVPGRKPLASSGEGLARRSTCEQRDAAVSREIQGLYGDVVELRFRMQRRERVARIPINFHCGYAVQPCGFEPYG